MLKLFEQLTSTRWSAALFIVALMGYYALVPLLVNYFLFADPYFVKLAQLCTLACVGIAIGFRIPVLDFRFRPDAKRITIDSRLFHWAVWGSFAAFVAVTLATADGVPLISALRGATEAELSVERGALLKTREGWQASLNYISALFTSSVVPYSLALLFLERIRSRWGAFALFLFYCQSSLEKALFLKVIVPLFYLVAQRKIWNYAGLLALALSVAGLIYLNTVLATGTGPGSASPARVLAEFIFKPFLTPKTEVPTQPEGPRPAQPQEQEIAKPQEQEIAKPQEQEVAKPQEQEVAKPQEQEVAKPGSSRSLESEPMFGPGFFKATYRPTGALDHLIWRSFAVPVFTAADALRVFDNKLDGRLLWGATSTLLASIFRLERVPFEGLVHGHQWGDGEAGPIGRANSVFITEAFVNYGSVGVIVFSLFIGQSLRWFYKSNDEAFKSLWLLYIFGLFSGGLLGNLFSNGVALLFFMSLFATITKSPKPAATNVGNGVAAPLP